MRHEGINCAYMNTDVTFQWRIIKVLFPASCGIQIKYLAMHKKKNIKCILLVLIYTLNTRRHIRLLKK